MRGKQCGRIFVAVVALAGPFCQKADAGYTNGLMRWMGWGVSDGYHVGRTEFSETAPPRAERYYEPRRVGPPPGGAKPEAISLPPTPEPPQEKTPVLLPSPAAAPFSIKKEPTPAPPPMRQPDRSGKRFQGNGVR